MIPSASSPVIGSMNPYLNHNVYHESNTPIHKLNTDVLLDVFTSCRDIEAVSIWAISRTCSQWRTLALEHSSLYLDKLMCRLGRAWLTFCHRWTHIVVNHASVRCLDSRRMAGWIRTWIERSGTEKALDVVIDLQHQYRFDSRFSLDWRKFEDLFLVISHQASRWHSFSYTLGHGVVANWPEVESPLCADIKAHLCYTPILRLISLKQTDDGLDILSPQYVYLLLSAETAPQLRSVSLSNIVFEGCESGWEVDHVSCEIVGPAESWNRLVNTQSTLQTYSSFKSLRLWGWASVGPAAHRLPFVLGRLEELTTVPDPFFAQVLSTVDMPCLADLTLDGRNVEQSACYKYVDNEYSPKLLDDLATRPSASILTTLTLYLPFQRMPWESIVHFAKLQKLHILMPDTDSFWSMCPSNMGALYTDRMKLGWHLPQLRTLVLESTEPYGSTGGELTGEWWELELGLKQLLADRWEAARGKRANIARLDVDIICSNWKILIRDSKDCTDGST
ncbi:hypothetical protein CALVIDRAFT_195766 [Calocera viscosa TUFC12733]|uniref:F-box domain-containing protein n=1 Tax=Calocera viscosa (strain TUFC12733) TaxID=1330018 RepID=A0A167KGS9_CALVF|nr:hypothetical protein CALVIDRAFT_195766 [Calocera viscosa TUFC12733]